MSLHNSKTIFNEDSTINTKLDLEINGLYIKKPITSSYVIDVSGNIRSNQTITSTSFNATSDYRIKQNVKDLQYETIDDLRPVSYFNGITKKQDYGLIAHEIADIYPSLVNGVLDDKNDYQSVNYTALIAILIKEIQNLKTRIKVIENLHR